MPNQMDVYLPLNTTVMVYSYSNASFLQKITYTQEDGTVKTAQGTGENNTPMSGGQFTINTPSSSSNPLGYKVTVSMQHSEDGGSTWNNSDVSSGTCSVMYYHLALVASEDYVDNDWNDGVAIFTWWLPPSNR